MPKRTTVLARALAATALVGAFVAVGVVVSSALHGGGSAPSKSAARGGAKHGRGAAARRNVPATYVVKPGDTLTSIANATGVPVGRIRRLNPEVDPQILIAGQELQLR